MSEQRETTSGTVLAVATVTVGDELAADAATGSTTITVTDAADFAESGGTLSINGQLTDYTDCDDATGMINLVDALTSDASEGDQVYLADPAGKIASELRATVQVVGALDSDEPIEAVLAHPIVPMLPEGIRDPGTGESVTLELLPGEEWQLVNVHGRKPIFDSDNAHYNVVTGTNVGTDAISITSTEPGPGSSFAGGDRAIAIGPDAHVGVDAGGAIAIGSGAVVGEGSRLEGNIAIGRGAAALAENIVAIGDFALSSADSGANSNTAVGANSLVSLTAGEFNTAVGAFGLVELTTGTHNTVIGEESALDLLDGHYNTFLGQDTGNGHTLLHGSYNTFVGCLTSVADDLSGTVTIGVDSAGNGATATADDQFVLGTANHLVQVPGRLNVAPRTPSGTADTQGAVGDITSDDSFVYVKTSAGWKRSALSTF